MAGCLEMRPVMTSGAAEHVPVIHKVRTILALFTFKKYRLPVVCMACAYIDEPSQPEVSAVRNPPEVVSRKYLKQALVVPTQEARSEAQSDRWPQCPCRRVQPTAWIPVEELGSNQQRLPFWYLQMKRSIELRSDALVERQVLPLEVVCEFGNIEHAVTGANQNGL
jgi:hypothetical protein